MHSPDKSRIRHGRTREDIVLSLKKSLIFTQKFESFNKKTPVQLKDPPALRSLKVLHISHPASPTFNPSPTDSSAPSFSFSQISRFEHSIFEKFKIRTPFTKRLSSEEKFLQEKRFAANQDMSQHSPDKKLEKLEEMSKIYEINKSIIQLARKGIIEEKKNEKESKMRMKFNKFEIRQKKGQCGDIKCAWVALLVVFGNTLKMKQLLHEKRLVREKVKKLYGQFRAIIFAVSRWVGVLVRNRKRIKVDGLCLKAYEECRRIALERMIQRIVLSEICELGLTRRMIHHLMLASKRTIIKIQRWVKPCLEYRRKVYANAFSQWKRNDNPISLKSIKKKGKKINSKSAFLTDDMKMRKIRSFIAQRVKIYLNAQQLYKANLKSNDNPPIEKPQALDMLSSSFLCELFDEMTSNPSPKRSNILSDPFHQPK